MGKKSSNYSNVNWGKSNAQIAKELGLDTSTVWRKRKRLNIPVFTTRNTGIETLNTGAVIDWDNSIRNSIKKRTYIKIQCPDCKQWRFTNSCTIRKIREGFINYCQQCTFNKRGKNSASGQRGIRKTLYGYIRRNIFTFREEERKIISPMLGTKSSVLLEHRAIMALYLQRPLLKTEIVHHLNGIKTDNRIENLQIINASDHKKEHKEIISELQSLRNEVIKLQKENKDLTILLAASMQ